MTILVVHDFDKSGLEILDKFTRNTRRYRYRVTPTVIDLGLRLDEARAMGLASEPVTYHSGVDPRESLRSCGADEAECAFLVQGSTTETTGTATASSSTPWTPNSSWTGWNASSGRGGGEGGP